MIVNNLNKIPGFRDWIVPNYYFSIKSNFFSADFIEKTMFNWLTEYFSPTIIVLVYSIFWILLGLIIAYLFIPKISNYIFSSKKSTISIINSIIFSMFYVFNYWSFERLLMGHIHVLRGYFIFPAVVYFLIKLFKLYNTQTNKNYFKTLIYTSILLLFISAISIHFYIFAIFSTIVYSLTLLVYTIKKGGLKSLQYNLKQKLLFAMKFFIVFLPSIIYSFFNLFLDRTVNLVQTLNINLVSKNEIIQSFSLRIADETWVNNIFFIGAIGTGSWMNNTFIEVYNSAEVLGIARYLFPYFSIILIAIFIVFVIYIFAIAIKLFKKNIVNYCLLIFAAISFILSFGYSLSVFYPVNFLINNLLPLIIIREPGKWYAVFWLILTVLIYSVLNKFQNEKIHKIKSKFIITFSLYYLCSVIFLFIVSLPSFNFVTYPKVLNQLNSWCSEQINGQQKAVKSVLIPDQEYFQSEYSNGLFIPNHYSFSSSCNFISSQYATIGENNLIISNSNYTSEIARLVNAENCNFEEIKAGFKKLDINLLLLDFTYYDKVKNFDICLQSSIEPIFVEGDIRAYFLD